MSRTNDEIITDNDRLLRRVIFVDPRHFRDDGTPSSLAFKLKKGESGLSVNRYRTNMPSTCVNFLSGMGSVLSVGGRNFMFNYSSSEAKADQQAIPSDWSVVGNDIRTSLH